MKYNKNESKRNETGMDAFTITRKPKSQAKAIMGALGLRARKMVCKICNINCT